MGKRDGVSSTKRGVEANRAELAKIPADMPVPELIACPRQPGKLRISRSACGRRHLLAGSREYRRPYGDFAIAFRWNLELCRNCPVGRMNARGARVTSRKPSRHKN